MSVYVIGVIFMHNAPKNKSWNVLFTLVVFGLYAYCLLSIYIDVGADDWNFTNALPTANVSPFTFACVGLSLFFPRIIKYRFLTLLSLLSVGMLAASLIECVSYFLRGYAFHYVIGMDVAAHVVLSLYGVYLVESEQVETDVKNVFLSGCIILLVAVVMLALNAIFHTSFFGLSVYGDHNIYGMVLTKDRVLSALLYFTGLCDILLIGNFYLHLLKRKNNRRLHLPL